MESEEIVKCLNCDSEQFFMGASRDEMGWHTICEMCNNSFDIDIEKYLISNNTRVLVHRNWIGTIQGNDQENSEEFENINYHVVPEGKTFDDEYMCPTDEFEIL